MAIRFTTSRAKADYGLASKKVKNPYPTTRYADGAGSVRGDSTVSGEGAGNIEYDLVADFGGDSLEWLQLLASSPIGPTYQLNIPAGSHDINRWSVGNRSAVIQGAGLGTTFVHVTGHDVGNNSGYGGASAGPPVFDTSGPQTSPAARINAATAGQTTVTLKVAGYASRFSVGDWVGITAFAMQPYGYPPNPAFFEYNKITNISGAVLTLETPLAQGYSDLYPDIPGDPTGFVSDCSGQANIWPINHLSTEVVLLSEGITFSRPTDTGWDQDFIVRDLTVTNTNTQYSYGASRHITYERVEFTGFKPACTVSKLMRFADCVFSGSGAGAAQEIDKMVEAIEYDGCSFVDGGIANFQSASIGPTSFTNCTGVSPIGAPRIWSHSNCAYTTFNISLDCSVFGSTTRGTITNCTAPGVDCANRGAPVSNFTDLTNGVFTITTADFNNSSGIGVGHAAEMVPGNACWLGNNAYCYETWAAFNVLDVRTSGSNTLIYTDIPNGVTLASFFNYSGTSGIIKVRAHACPDFTVTGSSGGWLDMYSRLGVTRPNRPFRESYHSGTITGTQGNQLGAHCVGNVVSITVDVTTPYTGVRGSLPMNVVGQFGWGYGFFDNWSFPLLRSALDVNFSQYNPIINLKQAGTRVIVPGSVTGTKSGDSDLALPSASSKLWTANITQPFINDDISGESAGVRPACTVTVITDQGIS